MDDRFTESRHERRANDKEDHNDADPSKHVSNLEPDVPSSSREQTVIRSVPRCDLERVADLAASGDVPFPEDLPADQLLQLAAMVRERRRYRLVQFIARAIAHDIRDEFESRREDETDAEESI